MITLFIFKTIMIIIAKDWLVWLISRDEIAKMKTIIVA
jgi:hypothetical protein